MILIEATVNWQQSVIAVMSVLSPFVIILIGFVVWKKQKVQELKYGIEAIRYESKLEAHKALWSLLKYLSKKENDKTIVIHRKNREEKDSFFVRKEPAEEFLVLLSNFYYDEGHGIFIENHIKKLLFEYRTQLYRLLDSERSNQDYMFEIKKLKLSQRLNNIYDELESHLMNEVQEGVVNDL